MARILAFTGESRPSMDVQVRLDELDAEIASLCADAYWREDEGRVAVVAKLILEREALSISQPTGVSP